MFTLKDKLNHMLSLSNTALEKGFSRAELMLTKDLEIDERVLMKCKLNACGQYNNNFMCPPKVLDKLKWDEVIKKYTFALLCQLTVPVPDDEYRTVFDTAKADFNALILALEREAFGMGFLLATGFAAGHCQVCEQCALSEGMSVCRLPSLARPSMEAVGLNVEEVNGKAGLATGFIPGEVTLTGMLLID